MQPTELNVILAGDTITSGPIVVPVSDPDEPAIDAIWRAYYAKHGARRHGGGPFEFGLVRWTLTDGTDDLVFVGLGRAVTVARFVEAFGPLATDTPAQLLVQVDGIGGDNWIVDLVSDGLEGLSIYEAVRSGYTLATRARFQEHRREVEQWQDTGAVSMRLRQLVLAEREWRPKEFTRRFAIDGRERGELLRACGYEPVWMGGRKVWVETDPG